MKQFCLAFFLLLLEIPLGAWGQGLFLRGRVLDSVSGQGLSNVNITMVKPNHFTITDAKGRFNFQSLTSGDYTLVFSYIGYASVEKKVHLNMQSGAVVINMLPKTESIGEVIISGKSEARKLKEQAAPISVINMSDLAGTVTTVVDVLQKTVGITMRNAGGVGSSSRISLRGLEGKRIGFFIDESPMSDQSDFVDLNDIPVDMIERVEIYKGIVPARFGGNAMGGAVNIVTKEYPDKYGDFSYEIGSYNTHKVQAVFKRNIKSTGLLISGGGGYTYSDNDYTMKSPYVDSLKMKRDNDQFKKFIFALDLKATKWWFDEITLEPTFADTYHGIQGYKRDFRKAHNTSKVYFVSSTMKKKGFFLDGLDLDMTSWVSSTYSCLVDTAHIRYDWHGGMEASPSKGGGELYSYPSNSNDKKTAFLNRMNLCYLINNHHSIEYNSVFSLANGYPKDDLRESTLEKKTMFNSRMRSLTVGMTYNYTAVHSKFLSATTLRHYNYWMKTKYTNLYKFVDLPEDVDLNKSAWGFSEAMRYQFSPHFTVKTSVGYEVRIPSENELLGDGISISPSGKLSPEKNRSFNIGFLYNLQDNPSHLQIELSTYYMYLTDMIRYVPSVLGGQYDNFGKMRTLGAEFEVKADVLPCLYSYANLTYQDLRDKRDYEQDSQIKNPTKDLRMPNIPYLMYNAGLEFHKRNLFGGRNQNTRLFMDLSYVHEYYYDFEMTNLDKRRIPTSTTVNLGMEHRIHDKYYLSFQIKNLTDERVISEFNRPLAGTEVGFKIRYIFN